MKEQLAQLGFVGIREPNLSWWPPALGWWLVLSIVLMIAYGIARYRKHAVTQINTKPINYRKQAEKELFSIEANFQQHQNFNLLAQEISQLLRRVVINERNDINDIAGLTGERWLAYLDRHFNVQHTFSSDLGIALTQSAYNPKVVFNSNELLSQVKKILSQVNSQASSKTRPLEQQHA